MEAPPYLSGQILLALPGIGDPRFDHAVIALCFHDADGALGIGVSTTMKGITLHALLEQFGIAIGDAPDAPVHAGGPVERQRGFVLHSTDWGGEDTRHVGNRWALTSTLDVLRAIAEGRGPSRYLVALGYAGWGEGQLDAEIARHAWFVTPGTDALLFDRPADARWAASFADAGVDTRLLSATGGRA